MPAAGNRTEKTFETFSEKYRLQGSMSPVSSCCLPIDPLNTSDYPSLRLLITFRLSSLSIS